MINFAQELKSKYISNSIDYSQANNEHCYKILTENDNLYEVHEQVSNLRHSHVPALNCVNY